jgi:hypothetical protein
VIFIKKDRKRHIFSQKKITFVTSKYAMKMKKDKMQHAMNYAAILGVYLLIKFYISVFSKENMLMMSVAFALTLFVPFIIYTIQKKYRDENCNGYIEYADAFRYGIYLFFYASLILALGQFIYYRYINLNFLADSFKETTDRLKSLGMGDKMIEKATKEGVPSAIATTFEGILLNTFVGIIISSITSYFIKKKPDLFDSNNE